MYDTFRKLVRDNIVKCLLADKNLLLVFCLRIVIVFLVFILFNQLKLILGFAKTFLVTGISAMVDHITQKIILNVNIRICQCSFHYLNGFRFMSNRKVKTSNIFVTHKCRNCMLT